MTTGRLDFGGLIETMGADQLNDIVLGSTYLASVIATLPENHRTMITYMLVDTLHDSGNRLPVLSKFMIELVANSISNKRFPDWARSEITNSVN